MDTLLPPPRFLIVHWPHWTVKGWEQGHPTIPLSHHPTVPPSHCPTIPLSSISPSHHLTIPLSSISPSHCPPSHHPTIPPSYHLTIPPSHCPTIPPSHRPTISPSHHPTIPLSYHPTIPLSHHLTIPPSHHLTIPPSHCPTIPPSHHPTIPLSHHPTVPPSHHPTIPLSYRPTISAFSLGHNQNRKPSSVSHPHLYRPLFNLLMVINIEGNTTQNGGHSAYCTNIITYLVYNCESICSKRASHYVHCLVFMQYTYISHTVRLPDQ